MEIIAKILGVFSIDIDDFLAGEGELLAFFCV